MTGHDDREPSFEVSEVDLTDCPAVYGDRRCAMAGTHRSHMALDDPMVFVEGPDAEPDERPSTRQATEWRIDHCDQLRLFLDAPSTVGAIDTLCELVPTDGADGDHEPSLDPLWCSRGPTGSPHWGRPLPDVIADTAPHPTWLEAAVNAGYVPTLAGVNRAVHALVRLFEAEVNVRTGSDPVDAAGHAIAASNAVRGIACQLDGLVAWLENSGARAMSVARREATTPYQPFSEQDIIAAVRRGRRAVQRSIHSDHDTRRAEAQWEDYQWRTIDL